MSKYDDPLIFEYWEKEGGTLCKGFRIVHEGETHGPRTLDAIILPDGPKKMVPGRDISLRDQDVIVVQAKPGGDKRGKKYKPYCLGMYLMGQTFFSAELVKLHRPRSIRSVALCKKNDSILGPLLVSTGKKIGVDIRIKEYPHAQPSPMYESPGTRGDAMIDWYWEKQWKKKGGILEKNFQIADKTDTNDLQVLHAVILPDKQNKKLGGDIPKRQDVIVVHAKAGGKKRGKYQPYRLGMYLMGQALFGAELIKQKFKPRSIRSIVLCEEDDSILHPILKDIGEKVGIDMEVKVFNDKS